MIVKCLAGLALLAAPASVAPAIPDGNAIPMVSCNGSRGSAVRIGPHLLVTAGHVIVNEGCKINGEPVQVVYKSTNDFAIIRTEQTGPFLKADCGGFIKDKAYSAVGHARGLPWLTTVSLIGTGLWNAGFAGLWGVFTVIPGQSGGAVIDDETGKVVGVINWYDMQKGISGSVELKGTPLCRS